MDLALYLNTDASDPARASVAGLVDRAFKPLPKLVSGTVLSLTIELVREAGGYHSASGDATLDPWLALGVPGQPSLVESDDVAAAGSAFEGSLDLATAALELFIAGGGRGLCLQFGTYDGTDLTIWAQLPVEIHRHIPAAA
jgi:hypothetical protein